MGLPNIFGATSGRGGFSAPDLGARLPTRTQRVELDVDWRCQTREVTTVANTAKPLADQRQETYFLSVFAFNPTEPIRIGCRDVFGTGCILFAVGPLSIVTIATSGFNADRTLVETFDVGTLFAFSVLAAQTIEVSTFIADSTYQQ